MCFLFFLVFLRAAPFVMSKHTRYLLEMTVIFALYSVLLVLSVRWLGVHPNSQWRIAVALVPMLPSLLIVVAVMRYLRRVDELQRQIQLEALGFAFAGTALITFGYGFLERVGFPRQSAFMVWPIMAVLWIIGTVLSRWRYR